MQTAHIRVSATVMRTVATRAVTGGSVTSALARGTAMRVCVPAVNGITAAVVTNDDLLPINGTAAGAARVGDRPGRSMIISDAGITWSYQGKAGDQGEQRDELFHLGFGFGVVWRQLFQPLISTHSLKTYSVLS